MKTGAVGYTPGSYYKRFKNIGLHQPRNMKAMNREAVESVNSAFANTGPKIFETKSEEYFGLSELAAQQVLKRAKELANKLAAGGESLSAANGGSGAAVNQVA